LLWETEQRQASRADSPVQLTAAQPGFLTARLHPGRPAAMPCRLFHPVSLAVRLGRRLTARILAVRLGCRLTARSLAVPTGRPPLRAAAVARPSRQSFRASHVMQFSARQFPVGRAG